MSFLEERFPDDIHHGSGFVTRFATNVTRTAGGNEYRTRRHPYLMAELDVEFARQTAQVINRIIDLNMRSGGAYGGFRVRNPLDFSTKSYRETPGAWDQPVSKVADGVYQLMRWYGDPQDPACSRRRIRKPVAGSVRVAVGSIELEPPAWNVDVTSGLVTLAANKVRAITGVTQASAAVVTVGSHNYSVGDYVILDGVTGMTQINGIRARISDATATTITVEIDSALFDAYVSGGTVQTWPLGGESVMAGCYFDLPMRFDSDLDGTMPTHDWADVSGINLIEILNP